MKRVSMAHNHYILEKLGLYLGFISLFELMNDDAHNVRVLFDKEILANRSYPSLSTRIPTPSSSSPRMSYALSRIRI
ncbi:YbaK/EbsC family protein [Limosilactobacillus reuteri]|uniref:hypothetical protein n=1 Tax=Limosilactobacillus reuteri TaxID=1598 RepID=UPI001E4A51B6|nr:hypothetical protein [Limosilactobacillus reuteri]